MRPIAPRAYLSYLIRLWLDDRGAWRASAEDPHQRDVRTFTDFEMLVRFLRDAIERARPEPGRQDE